MWGSRRIQLVFQLALAVAVATSTVAANSATTEGFTEVSVCKDAVYAVPASRGAVCAGVGAAPVGTACPLKGDRVIKGCYSNLRSSGGKKCVAKEDAKCRKVKGATWGCVFPSTGCGNQKDHDNKHHQHDKKDHDNKHHHHDKKDLDNKHHHHDKKDHDNKHHQHGKKDQDNKHHQHGKKDQDNKHHQHGKKDQDNKQY